MCWRRPTKPGWSSRGRTADESVEAALDVVYRFRGTVDGRRRDVLADVEALRE